MELAPETAKDFDRILSHLLTHEVNEAAARIQEILAAIDVLATNPLIGRPAENDLKELVIGKGSRGYVALYRYAEQLDIVYILAIRGQREAGYGRGVA
ncbi:MAG: type II toxin-antitoxin system RelE/ParE family toxin [Betaproteobacteria bacterium]|nr:type II toxin-antitoxin system RelE/ParE family toxin [Betaproteobacteria bacterium]